MAAKARRVGALETTVAQTAIVGLVNLSIGQHCRRQRSGRRTRGKRCRYRVGTRQMQIEKIQWRVQNFVVDRKRNGSDSE